MADKKTNSKSKGASKPLLPKKQAKKKKVRVNQRGEEYVLITLRLPTKLRARGKAHRDSLAGEISQNTYILTALDFYAKAHGF